jgi:hypothetical protein
MPELARFYGIIIRMFYNDHAPPHFHAVYAGQQVQINIATLQVMHGSMRARALEMTLEWAAQHRVELQEAWNRASQNQTPDKIAPLE